MADEDEYEFPPGTAPLPPTLKLRAWCRNMKPAQMLAVDVVDLDHQRVTLETGLVIQVPIFVEAGDTVRVDTRTGEYLTRV